MDARRKVKEAMDRHNREASRIRVAGLPPELEENAEAASGGKGFNNSASTMKRAIPKGYSYDPKALKPLARVLWAMSVSLGHAMTAHRQFARLKSATFSPDGLMGGRGYVMPIKDMRKELYNACEALSAISDTVFDEINAPHWKPKLGQLEREDMEDISQLVGDASRILEDPQGEAEEDLEEAEEGHGKTKGAPWTHPAVRKKNKQDPGSSEVPHGEDQEVIPDDGKGESDPGQPLHRVKQASAYTYARTANSSVPVQFAPGGPRVDHIGPAQGQEYGAYNDSEPSLPEGDGGTYVPAEPAPKYNYPSSWENELNKTATSHVPNGVTDSTPTEGFDYGLGLSGGNDAHGQGQNHVPVDPDTGGFYGPRSEVPGDLGGGVLHDTESDSNPTIESEYGTGGRGPRKDASARWKAACGGSCSGGCTGGCQCNSQSELPNDKEPPVARSDYFEAAAEMPGDETSDSYEWDHKVSPGAGYRYERGNQPYIKWDYTTHQMRPDPIYQRKIEGPYTDHYAAETEPSNG